MLAQRDDATALVIDSRWAGRHFTAPVSGRRGTGMAQIARPAAAGTRLWLWPGRLLRLQQHFDAAGRLLHERVDFASPPWRAGAACYQTDFYLDLFAAPAGADYAIEDEDELELALARGLLPPDSYRAVLAQLDELVVLLESGRWGTWLASFCEMPFALDMLPAPPAHHYRDVAPGAPDGWPGDSAPG